MQWDSSLKKTSVLLLSLVMLASCAGPQKREKSKVQQVFADGTEDLEGKEKTHYSRMSAYYRKKAYRSTLMSASQFLKKFPNSSARPQAYNFKGLSYLLLKKPTNAISAFKAAAEISPNDTFLQYVLYNKAKAEYESGRLTASLETLNQIDAGELDPLNRLKFFYLRGRINRKKNNINESINDFLVASRYLAEQPTLRKAIESYLSSNLKEASDVEYLEAIYDDNKNAAFADHVLFRLASLQMSHGQIGDAESGLRRILRDFPNSSLTKEATELLLAIEEQTAVDTNVVGVLLPLNGKLAPFGEEALKGIELAFQVYNRDHPGNKITLVIEDSGSTPEEAIAALNRLYFKHHVIAVVGPLSSRGIKRVTKRAQNLGLPLVSLAQYSGNEGEFIFQSGLNPRLQAYEVAQYAIQTLGIKKFAILYSRDKFGREHAKAFWNAVEEFGGEITGIESYRSGETDFRTPIDKLSGLHYKDARQFELDALAELRETDNITRRNRRTEHYYTLKPIVDYEAVYIPDAPQVVGQILPTFAYRDVEKVTFLGPSTWNSDEILRRAGEFAEGSYFVDGYYKGSQDPRIRTFITEFHKNFDVKPSPIGAVSFDAASILHDILVNEQVESRSEVRGRLQDISNFPGVTGNIYYKDGYFFRSLKVFTVRNKNILELR